jgi:hypothetical protein
MALPRAALLLVLAWACSLAPPCTCALAHYPEPPPPGVPASRTVTNATLEATLQRVAGRSRTVVFTTLRISAEGEQLTKDESAAESVVAMVSNFCYWLHKAGLLKRTMLLTTDVRTWRLLHERGFPGAPAARPGGGGGARRQRSAWLRRPAAGGGLPAGGPDRLPRPAC